QWDRHHPLRQRLVEARPQTADAVAAWVKEFAREMPGNSRPNASPTASTSLPFHPLYAELSANAALTLVTVAGYLLDRHLQALSAAFEREGGFTERLYRVRSRGRQTGSGGTMRR
ncbi:MAG: four helix bundle suffix domain-containing protein, partial [Lentisphaeria bacterium]|nr:four helix bundle suffix domain-containing protein [Lentisphaeria bacterium]